MTTATLERPLVADGGVLKIISSLPAPVPTPEPPDSPPKTLPQAEGSISLTAKTIAGLPLMDVGIGAAITFLGAPILINPIANAIPGNLSPGVKLGGAQLGVAWLAFKFGGGGAIAKTVGILLTAMGVWNVVTGFVPGIATIGGVRQQQDMGGLDQGQASIPLALSRNTLAGV